jgi:hypothetical protein
MRIGLGTSVITGDARHTALLIVFLQSFYFIALGFSMLLYDQQVQQQQQLPFVVAPPTATVTSMAESDAAAAAAHRAAHHGPSAELNVLTLNFLLGGRDFAQHPHTSAVLIFLLHALLFGALVGAAVERRAWAFDAVLSAEALYLVISCVSQRTFLPSAWLALCVIVDALLATAVAFFVAAKREQQEIVLAPQQAV